MKYTFTKEELVKILKLNGFNSYSYYGENGAKSFKKDINNKILSKLIISQPELKAIKIIFENKLGFLFKEGVDSESFINLFAEFFKDQIKLKNLEFHIFENNNVGIKESSRKKFLLELNKRSGFFINLFIKDNKVNNDITLCECYLNIIKKEKNLLNNFNENIILDSIKKIETYFNKNLSKLKLDTYLSLFKKDQYLYDLISENMIEVFEKYVVLDNYWESKAHLFEKNVIFKIKNNVSAFTKEESFYYRFIINEDWIIKKQKISEKQAKKFCIAFNRSLKLIVNNLYDVNFIDFATLGDQTSQICLTVKTKEEAKEIKAFFSKVTDNIDILLSKFDHNSGIELQMLQIEEYVESFKIYDFYKKMNTDLLSKKEDNKLKIKL